MKFKPIYERNKGYIHLFCKCGGVIHTEISFAVCESCLTFYQIQLKKLKSMELKI